MPKRAGHNAGSKTETAPGVWRIHVSAGAGPDGKRRRVSRTVHGGAKTAQDALDRLKAEVGRGDTTGDSRTLADLLAAWRPTLPARGLQPTTIENYQRAAARLARASAARGGRSVTAELRSEARQVRPARAGVPVRARRPE